MAPNLGDLLSYGYLGIVKLPTHSNLCPSRMMSVHCCYFRFLVTKYPDLCTLSTLSRCRGENLRPLFGGSGVGLSLKSAFRFCIGHRRGGELKNFPFFSVSPFFPPIAYREDLIQIITTLASSRSTCTIGTPGAQVGFIPTGTAVPYLVYTPRPYFFD